MCQGSTDTVHPGRTELRVVILRGNLRRGGPTLVMGFFSEEGTETLETKSPLPSTPLDTFLDVNFGRRLEVSVCSTP